MVGSPVWPRRGREGEKHTLGLVEFGSVGAATALRCAVVGCGGDKGEERAGSLRGGMERDTGGRREENGWLGIERERGRDRERRHWQTG